METIEQINHKLELRRQGIKQSEASLKEILTNNNPITDKQLTYNQCQRCHLRIADSVMNMICHVCYRKLNYDQLPEFAQIQERLSIVPERYIHAKLEDLPKAVSDALVSENSTGVYLWGPPGVGKTYSLCALANYLVSEGYVCRRFNYEHLCLKLRDTFKPASKESEWSIIEPLVNADRLFMEDIGTTKSIDAVESDFSLRTLLVIIDIRLERCRPTYITTNKSVENLTKSFDSRIGDRLKLYNILKLSGESKR